MRIEPIPQGLWLRLFDGKLPEPHRKRTSSRSSSAQPARQRPARPLEPLPLEVWDVVFRMASPCNLCSLRASCKSWQRRLDHPEADAIWEAAYRAEWCLHGAAAAAAVATAVLAAERWRLLFLARWWAYGRWGNRSPTVSTLMGKKAHGGTVTCVALGECGLDSGEGTALSASDDGSIFHWRFAGAAGHAPAAAAPVVAQQHHRQCQGVDVRCPQRTKQFYGHAGPVWCLCYDPEQELLLSGGYDATVKLWSLAAERCVATLRGHDGWVRSLAVVQRCVVSGGSDGILKFWNLDTRRCLRTAGPPNVDPRHSTHSLAAIGESTVLSAHSDMRHLLLWDLARIQSQESFHGHDDDIYAIHADRQSSLLASGSKDRTVRVFDLRQPRAGAVGVLRGHTGAVLDVKLRGHRLVSASMDKTAKMWDLRRPDAPLATLEGHSADVHCVDFRDRMVLSGSRDTSLKVWTVI